MSSNGRDGIRKMDNKKAPFRFAVMGAGNIANKFCDAVTLLENCLVAAVASKSYDKAESFAKKHKITGFYGSYEQMLTAEKPDCVYIATSTDAHYELTMLCLEHSVPVICEKAMFMNSEHAKQAFALSRQKNVFAMEAMWSRFLPAVNKAREWIAAGKLGELVCGNFMIGFHAPEDPENRYFNPKLGGGATFDLLVYGYEITTYLIGCPAVVETAEAVFTERGVDVTDHVLLRFGSDMLVSLDCTFLSSVKNEMVLYGKRGKLVLPAPHYSSEAFLYNEAGDCIEHYRDENTVNGFTYEIEEAVNCIRRGQFESQVVPHELTLECAKLFDRLLQ